ncbi:MAG: hypothetical protein J6P03_07645, partial [Opitutales bacterium]|nr:hypothetical protein [Opitutales bacterium]
MGRWAKQAGSSAPYLIENIGARVAGGATGSVAGPGGTTVGQTLGGMAVGYSQGWGELFERLVNEGVDKDEAAKISFVLAAPYAGIEALQVGPILNRMGLGKYAAGAFSKKIGDLIAKNPVLRSKVARALGDRAKGVLGESVEEGLQGGVMNAGEQWARGTWSTAEFFQAIKDDTVESVGPMGITLGVASGIGKYRQWRANKHLGKNQKEEFENEARFQPFVKRAWAKETGTPIGVSSEMPQGEKERVVWATKFTKQDREEIFNKAGEMAQRDLDGYKAENPGASAEDLKAFFDAALAHHARELAVFAHNFKLRVCDLDLDSYAFDRVFAPKKAAAAQAERPEGQPGESAGEGAPGAQNMSETQPGGEQNLPDAGQDNDEKKSRISLEGDTRSEAELDALNAKHRELYERYKNGDQSAYEEAAKLVAEEGGRKGYEVKVYHGTGADGFDVADATSKHQDNGEGAQAHGRGVYMAVSRDTAEGYRNRSNPINVVRLGDKAIDYQKMGFASLDELIDEVYDLRDNYNLKSNPKGILDSLLSSLPYWEKQAREAREKIAQGDTAYEYNLKEAEEQINYINADAKKLQKWIGVFGEGQTLSDLNVHRGFGRVFDWFHNMKPGEVIDQDKPISEQPDILEKFKKAYEEDILPLLKEAFGFDEDEFERAKAKLNTNRVAGRVISSAGLLIGGDKFAQILLKHGIRGTKYVGRRDGEVYTSFEGGSTVKLQDPFTFDDNGELIPLAERFDSANPSMRYRFGKKWSRQAVGGFDFSGPVDPRGEAEYKKYKEQIGKPNEKLKIKPVMHPNLQLPRSVRDKKIGIASPSGIRRWVLAALDIPFMGEVSSVQKRSGLAGAYYLKRDSLHLNSEQIAELDTLFHEIGHALDLRIFNGKAASVPKKIRAELVDWIVKNGKARGLAVEAYSAAELPGEGWAEFMADFMLDPASAKKNLPLTFAFFSAALNDNKPLKKIMTQARKMIAGYVEAPEAKRAKVHVVADSDLNAFKEPLSKRIYGAYEAIGKSFADLFGSLSDLQDYVNAVAGEGAADFDARR